MRRVYVCPGCGKTSEVSDDRLAMLALGPIAPFGIGGYFAWRYFGWPGLVLDAALGFVVFAFVLQRVPLEPLEERKSEQSPEDW